jgi:hypothetical protein
VAHNKKEYNKQYYEQHKEQIADQHRQYASEHKEEIAAKKRNYYEQHIEECTARRKQWYEAHKQEAQEHSKQYHETHKEANNSRHLQYSRDHREPFQVGFANRKAKRLGVPGKLTTKQIRALFALQNNRCACCGKPCKLTIDHVIPFSDPACTNTIENTQGLCLHCNCVVKGERTIRFLTVPTNS